VVNVNPVINRLRRTDDGWKNPTLRLSIC